jgi:hypothetical protein
LSPQSRRGHASTPSHRKPAPRVTPDASRKPAKAPVGDSAAPKGDSKWITAVPADVAETATSSASGGSPTAAKAPTKSAAAVPTVAAKDAKAKSGTRPTERKAAPTTRRRSVGRSSTLRNVYRYISAYVPLIIVMAIALVLVWGWTTWGPHTNTPAENWTQIENIWQPKRDADLQAASLAVKNGDFNATLAAYKNMSADLKGWTDQLATIKSWEAANVTPDPASQVTATNLVAGVVNDGQSEIVLLNQASVVTTPDGLLALKPQLDSADQTFMADLDLMRQSLGKSAAASGAPTLALPSGSLSPSGSPAAGSAAPSASLAPSASVAPTASVAPSASASPTAGQ